MGATFVHDLMALAIFIAVIGHIAFCPRASRGDAIDVQRLGVKRMGCSTRSCMAP